MLVCPTVSSLTTASSLTRHRCITQEAEDMNLPRLAQRGRRKSKDLEDQAMDLMGSQLEKVFKLMDVSGDGNLDEAELKRAYELAGRPASDESIKKAIQLLDKDNDGLINLEEFKAIAWQTSIEDQEGERAAAAAAAAEAPEDEGAAA